MPNTLHSVAHCAETLYCWHLIVDGNAHRPDLMHNQIGFDVSHQISEAMIPEIRTLACLIAAQRYDEHRPSPDVFTEEADWFAARILLFSVRSFDLEITLLPMLKIANERARQFALTHALDYTPAKISASMHTDRPQNMLKFRAPIEPSESANWLLESLAIRQKLRTLFSPNLLS